MNRNLLHLMRTFAALLVWGMLSTPVVAAGWNLRGDATPAPKQETLWGLPRDDPAIAVGAIVGALLIFILVAWVGSRIGDKS